MGLVAGGFAVVLAAANAALFLFARRSAWAWRVATDDGLSTWMLRLATLAMSHYQKAQIWILDLYFYRLRTKIPPKAAEFLPLPLTSRDGEFDPSDKALASPWTGKRLWVQGNSGMGKTALFRRLTEAHFRDHETAFAAFANWGCVVVAFAARDFADGGEDKGDPAWVVGAVRSRLSSQGVKFGDEKLLSRFLESGSIGIAIDGLNEVNRTRAVIAFTQSFYAAPMLVTSQQGGPPVGDCFTCWYLPDDIRAFTAALLREYLGQKADTVMVCISNSGLKDELRSGYDVRLIIDLVKAGSTLPSDRLGLYAAVIAVGWPKVSEEIKKRQQQSRMEAAAWRMVSERKANEDTRRLKPNVDLDADLLEAIADAPEKDQRPVRLIRRVAGADYEFVHDQMHAYLAARWFTQEGFRVTELEKMIEASTIWTHAVEERRPLWDFAARLLDDERLIALWARVEDKEDWDTRRRALKAVAERRGLRQPVAAQIS
jgi:hypothetical protein